MGGEIVGLRSVQASPGRAHAAVAWCSLLLALALTPAVLSVGFASWALVGVYASLVAVIVGTLVGRRTRGGGELALTDQGLRVPAIVGARSIARDDVESAYEVDGGLVLTTRSGSVVALQLAEPRGADVLRHLGLTLDQATLTAPLRGMIGGFTRGLLAFVFGFPISSTLVAAIELPWPWGILGVLASFVASLVIAVLVASKLRPRVVVGVDGLRVVGVLRPVFVPHGDIREVRVVDNAGYLALFVHAGARSHLLPLVGQSPVEAAALARRVEEGRARHRGAAGVRDLSALDRVGMSFPEWRENLRRTFNTSGGFRAAALEPKDFEEVLRDPAAPIGRRVGAALALREGGSEAIERIRVAASTSAEPRVRVALEAVAADEVDASAVEAALRKHATG